MNTVGWLGMQDNKQATVFRVIERRKVNLGVIEMSLVGVRVRFGSFWT